MCTLGPKVFVVYLNSSWQFKYLTIDGWRNERSKAQMFATEAEARKAAVAEGAPKNYTRVRFYEADTTPNVEDFRDAEAMTQNASETTHKPVCDEQCNWFARVTTKNGLYRCKHKKDHQGDHETTPEFAKSHTTWMDAFTTISMIPSDAPSIQTRVPTQDTPETTHKPVFDGLSAKNEKSRDFAMTQEKMRDLSSIEGFHALVGDFLKLITVGAPRLTTADAQLHALHRYTERLSADASLPQLGERRAQDREDVQLELFFTMTRDPASFRVAPALQTRLKHELSFYQKDWLVFCNACGWVSLTGLAASADTCLACSSKYSLGVWRRNAAAQA